MVENKLKIILYSDYICPFCYIGYLRIEKLKKELDAIVEWRPFEVHPETPKEGAFLQDLPFPKEYLNQVLINLERLAKEEGIKLSFPEKLPNSRLAIYISEFAKNKGKFEEFHKKIFEAYWKEGKDIGNLTLLFKIAVSIGLDQKETIQYLESETPRNQVNHYLRKIRKYGLNGVPIFFIGNKIVVEAQPYEILKTVAKEALKKK